MKPINHKSLSGCVYLCSLCIRVCVCVCACLLLKHFKSREAKCVCFFVFFVVCSGAQVFSFALLKQSHRHMWGFLGFTPHLLIFLLFFPILQFSFPFLYSSFLLCSLFLSSLFLYFSLTLIVSSDIFVSSSQPLAVLFFSSVSISISQRSLSKLVIFLFLPLTGDSWHLYLFLSMWSMTGDVLAVSLKILPLMHLTRFFLCLGLRYPFILFAQFSSTFVGMIVLLLHGTYYAFLIWPFL